jgi:pimeloyl-ACP methyl ester carboxylesterase
MNVPQNFEISQQSRDAVAVLHATGEQSAFVFGNSSGAVIALDMASTQPGAIRVVVVHEAPLPRLLPNPLKWQRFFASVNLTAYRYGSSLAALQFMIGANLPVMKLLQATKGVNEHMAKSSLPYLSPKVATEVLTKFELLPITNYPPDVKTIRKNGIKVFIAVGKWGLEKQVWYVEAAQILAKQLDCELLTFPGHHGSFMDMPDEFAAALRAVLLKEDGRSAN